jgi:hypothetical protein
MAHSNHRYSHYHQHHKEETTNIKILKIHRVNPGLSVRQPKEKTGGPTHPTVYLENWPVCNYRFTM